nr:MAG TPA: hypothetical protein [Caudoviricetes sp.]
MESASCTRLLCYLVNKTGRCINIIITNIIICKSFIRFFINPSSSFP